MFDYRPLGLIWVFVLSLFAAACASNTPPEHFVLKPVASNDDSKRFTYGVRVGRQGGGPGRGGPGGASGGGGSGSGPQGSGQQGGSGGPQRGNQVGFEQLREALEDYMALNQYCTEGYFIYDETYNGNEYLLHGECQESKNDE